MAKESSVAPKERVNIVYKPATGESQEEVELPLKQLVLGQFSDKFADKRLEDRKSTSIDKDNFNDVLNAYDVKVDLEVANKLVDDPDAEMNISLDFKTMKDFGPEAIAQKVPELDKILKLRDALLALKGPLSNVPEFRNKIQSLIQDDSQRDQLLAELGLEN
jgi:type VI secretion system protein ImpB